MGYPESAEANESVALYFHSNNSIQDSCKFTCLFGVFTLICDLQVKARVYGTH